MKKKNLVLGILVSLVMILSIGVDADEIGSAINLDGQNIILEAPIKAGKDEAETTETPSEPLLSGKISQSSSRALTPIGSVAMYRIYNARSGEHFYTSSSYERDSLRKVGWNYEGVGWQAPTTGIPVYRLYNPNSGEHFYTVSSYERDNLKRIKWRYEGIGWYSYAGVRKIPVYRMYNPNSGWHHYTLSSYERDSLRQVGWHYEGISWSAVGQGQPSYEDYRLLGVNNYNQYASGAPSGCEGASLLQALQYKGKLINWGLIQFLKTIPKSPDGNPNNGFVGSSFIESSSVYSAIYPAPLTAWAKKYGNVQNISGSSVSSLVNQIKIGNPVITWVTINFQPVRWGAWPFGAAVNNNHAVTLDGYNKSSNQVHVSDPISGSYWLSRATFETIYDARKYAVVVK